MQNLNNTATHRPEFVTASNDTYMRNALGVSSRRLPIKLSNDATLRAGTMHCTAHAAETLNARAFTIECLYVIVL